MADSLQSIEEFICGYIGRQPGNRGLAISPACNYVEEGILDSFAILSMIMDLESCYGIKFQAEELVVPGIKKISGLALMIHNKQSKASV